MAKRTFIESLGVYLPSGRLSTKEVMDGCRNKLKIDLEEITGIKSRPIVGDNEYAIDLAINAISKCFEASEYSSKDIEMIISTNICRLNGPNHEFSYEPSTAAKLASHFGIENAITFDISNACAGMFTGVHIMDSYIKAGVINKGIVVSGEYITHLAKNAQKEIQNPIDLQMASLTLGDSGAAVILEGTNDPSVGFHQLEFFTVAQHCDLCVGTMSKEDHGGYVMYTESSKAHRVAIDFSAEHTGSTIKDTWWEEGKNYHMIPHQTATRALRSIIKTFNNWLGKPVFSEENLIMNVEERGNNSSTAHFIALWDHIKNGTIKPNGNILFVIQASGITIAVATYTLDDLPNRISTGKQVS